MKTIISAIILTAIASIASAQAPFPGAVQIGPDWVPCDHPIAVRAGVGCVPGPVTQPIITPPPYEPPKTFRVLTGRTYESVAGGWRLFIVGPVQRADERVVTLAEVVDGVDRYGRMLFDRGQLLEVPSEWLVADWREIRP